MLKKRSDKIQGELEDAKLNQEQAIALKQEYEAKLKDINKEDTKQTTERKTEENSDALRTILRHTPRF